MKTKKIINTILFLVFSLISNLSFATEESSSDSEIMKELFANLETLKAKFHQQCKPLPTIFAYDENGNKVILDETKEKIREEAYNNTMDDLPTTAALVTPVGAGATVATKVASETIKRRLPRNWGLLPGQWAPVLKERPWRIPKPAP